MTTNISNELTHSLTETVDDLEPRLRQLRLSSWGAQMKNDLQFMQPTEQGLILKYLAKWSMTALAEKKAAQIESKIKAARFKQLQTIDAFDFAFSKATQTAQKNYLALLNSTSADNLPSAVFNGSTGVGKTHLSRALGYRACQQNLSTLFVTASDMVNHLVHAQKTFNLESELNKYRRPQVLIIDELGYVSLDAQASNLFFQVISARHDQGLGTITTTNITFGKFNQIFANDAIAHAIVDRLVNEAQVFYMEGPSYREHQRKQKQNKAK